MTATVSAALALAALGGSAAAATVEVSGGALRFIAAPGERNEVTIMAQGIGYTVQDGSSANRPTVTASPPCRLSTEGSLFHECPPTGIERIEVTVGDNDDYASTGGLTGVPVPATIDGGPGNDTLRGTARDDRLDGGPGNDTLEGVEGLDLLSGGDGVDIITARDGYPDRVVCGPGVDRVTADETDAINADCELINGIPNGVDIDALLPDVTPLARLATRGLRVSLTCERACSVRAALRLAGEGSAKPVVLGSARASRRGKGRLYVVTRLTARSARALRRLNAPPIQIELVLRERGRAAVTRRAGIWLQ